MVHDVIATCPVCSGQLTITRLLPAPAGRRWRASSASAASGGSTGSARPAQELPPLARQPQGDGARARHQLPHRPRPGRRPRARPRLRRRPIVHKTLDDATCQYDVSTTRRRRPDTAAQRAILERLARKEIGAEEAAEALRALGAGGAMATYVGPRRSRTTSARAGASCCASPAQSRAARRRRINRQVRINIDCAPAARRRPTSSSSACASTSARATACSR